MLNKPLFICSFPTILEALDKGVVTHALLDEALFFFPLLPENYVWQAGNRGREKTLGPSFRGNLERGRKVLLILLAHLKKAKSEGRVWYENHQPDAFKMEMKRLGFVKIMGEVDDRLVIEKDETPPTIGAAEVFSEAKELMASDKLIIIGGGVPLSDVEMLLVPKFRFAMLAKRRGE